MLFFLEFVGLNYAVEFPLPTIYNLQTVSPLPHLGTLFFVGRKKTLQSIDLNLNLVLAAAKNIQRGGGPSISRPSALKSWPPLDFLQQLCTPPKMTTNSLDPP